MSEPDLIEEVLVRRTKDFTKAHMHEKERLPWGKKILGSGLLNSDGPTWLRQRRAMQPSFQRGPVARYDVSILELTVHRVEAWVPRREIDLYSEMSELVLEILAMVVLGRRGAAKALHAPLRDLFAHRDPRSLIYLLPEWVPTPSNLRTGRALRKVDAALFAAIDERKRSDHSGDDLLSSFLRTDPDVGAAVLRDAIMSTFVAGHDTLAATLTWALDILARHPAQRRQLIAELSTLGGRDAVAADLGTLPRLDAVAREILRMFPPGKSVARVAVADTELAGHRVPRDCFVVMSQWVVQRDPRIFLEPNEFRPERWSSDLAARLHRYAYFPFGGGPRLCLGTFLADLTLRLVLAAVVRRVDLDGSKAGDWDPATLRPRGRLLRVAQSTRMLAN